MIRRKYPVVAMPVLPRRRDEIGEPVEKIKWREFDDTIGPRPGGPSAAAGANPGGGFVPGEHVADFGCAAVWAACHGESLECKAWPGAVSQEMFEALTLDTQLDTVERDPDTRID